MTERRPSRHQAYLLGALLVVATAAPLALESLPWIDLFTRGPSLIDLDAPFGGPVHHEGQELVVVGGDRESALLRTPFPGRTGGKYLLRLHRAESPPLAVNLIGPNWTRVYGPERYPEGGGLERIVLHPSEVPAGTQLVIAFRPPGDLRILGLELYEVAPSHRLFPPFVRSLAPLLALVLCVRYWRWLAGHAESPGVENPWDRRLLALALFLVGLLAFYRAPVDQVSDSRYLAVVSQSLLTQGTTAIPDELLTVDPARVYQLVRVGDRTFHFFSHAPAVLNVPFVWVYGLFGVYPVDASRTFLPGAETEILRFGAAVIAASLCLALYGIGRRWLPAGPSLTLVAVFAFGTQILSTMSRPYWSHAWASLLLAGALYLLVAPATRDRAAAYVASASLLSWAFFCRPIMALSVIGVTILVASRRRAFLAYLVIPGLVWAILFVLYSQQMFGQPLPGYTLSWHLYTGRLTVPTAAEAYPGAILGTLFSPSRGLFVFVPFFVLVLWLVAHRWRRLADRGLAVVALAVILVHWQVICLFRNWWGGAAYGPRLFSDVVVWFFVLAALGLAAGARAGKRPGGAVRTLGRIAAGVLVAFSLFVHVRGATAPETMQWPDIPLTDLSNTERHQLFQQKVWDWRHPQFLAGLLDRRAESE